MVGLNFRNFVKILNFVRCIATYRAAGSNTKLKFKNTWKDEEKRYLSEIRQNYDVLRFQIETLLSSRKSTAV